MQRPVISRNHCIDNQIGRTFLDRAITHDPLELLIPQHQHTRLIGLSLVGPHETVTHAYHGVAGCRLVLVLRLFLDVLLLIGIVIILASDDLAEFLPLVLGQVRMMPSLGHHTISAPRTVVHMRGVMSFLVSLGRLSRPA